MPVTISQLRATIGMDAREFDQGIKEVNAALTKMGGDATVAGKKLADALANASTQAGRSLDKLGSKLSSVGKGLSLGVTAPLLLLGKAAVDVAATFEQNMNVLQATSGATGEQMSQLSKLSKDLGADLELPGTSAGDAAKALLELTKGGLSVKDAMDAARPTLQLSAAAQIDNARAAQIVADSLNEFSLAGNQAARVADLLAGAQIAAGGTIDQMSQALQQSGAAFASQGLNINEAVTAISLMAKAGIRGTDAGTSLKTMLMRLSSPTKEAAGVMEKLGIHMHDLATGKTRPLRDIVADLGTKIGTLTEKQRAQVAETIGGSDAFRALTILAKAGGEGFDKMAAKVSKEGTAAKLAGAQNKGLAGAIDAMKSAFQTAAQAGIEPIIGDLTRLAKSVGELVNKFSELPAGTRRFIVGILAGAAALGPLLIGLGNVVKAVGTLKAALAAARAGEGIAAWLASGPVLGSIAAIVGAITFLAVAWENNWGHVQQFTAAVWTTIIDIFNNGAASIKDIAAGFAEMMGGNLIGGAKKLAEAGENIGRTFVANYVNELGKLETEQQAALDKAAAAAKTATAAAAQDAPRLPGVTVPGLNLDGKESEATKQLKRFKQELAEVTIKLAAAQRGESKTSQDLLSQYDLVSKGLRDTLIQRQEALDTTNKEAEAQKNFREELTRVNASIVALKSGGNTVLADLAKQFPGVSQGQLEFLANQKEVEKHLGIQGQKIADVNRQLKEMELQFKMTSAKKEGGSEPLFTQEEVFIMKTYNRELTAISQAEKDRAAQLFKQQQIAERNTIILNQFAQEQDNVRLASARAFVQLRDANVALDLTTQGSAAAMFAWQQFGVILDQVDDTTRGLIIDLFNVTNATNSINELKQSFQGVFTDAFKNVNHGFKAFTESIVNGVDEMLRDIAAKFLAARLTEMLFNAIPGGGKFLGGIISGGTVGAGVGGGWHAPMALPGKARGGPVNSSSAYLVGENGPEMFVPSRSGRIVPNGQMAAAGGGNVIVNMTVHATDAASFKRSESEIRSSAYRIGEAAKKRNLG